MDRQPLALGLGEVDAEAADVLDRFDAGLARHFHPFLAGAAPDDVIHRGRSREEDVVIPFGKRKNGQIGLGQARVIEEMRILAERVGVVGVVAGLQHMPQPKDHAAAHRFPYLISPIAKNLGARTCSTLAHS